MIDTIIYYARRYWKQVLVFAIILFFGIYGFVHPRNTTDTPHRQEATRETVSNDTEETAKAATPTPSQPAENTTEPASTSTPTSNPEDDTPAVTIDETSGFSDPLSTTPLTIKGTDYDKVCAGIADYVYDHSRQFTGIATTYLDQTETSTNWQVTSDPDYEAGYETWTTTANEANGPDDFPVVTAEVEEKDDSFVVHRLSVGGVMFIKDATA